MKEAWPLLASRFKSTMPMSKRCGFYRKAEPPKPT